MAALTEEVPERVLAVYAHPDDPDVAAGGTIARWSSSGAEVHVCICARGDKGSSDPSSDPDDLAAERRLEVERSGLVLGVTEHHWLGFDDGELDVHAESLRRMLVALMRSVRPDTVVTADPTAVFFGQHYVNHRDHRSVGWAVLDAVAPAVSNPHYYPDAGPPHSVGRVYLSGTLDPQAWVDITKTIDVKASAIACHRTQVGDNGEYLRRAVRQRAEESGRQASVAYAESFRVLTLA